MFAFRLETSEASSGCKLTFCTPVAQGKRKARLSCLKEVLEKWYSLGPGVISVFTLGSPQMCCAGAVCFPCLVMEGWT